MIGKPFIYLAGPYIKGSPSLNTTCQLSVYHQLVKEAFVTPYAPLFAHHLLGHELIGENRWLDLGFEVIKRSNGLLSVNAKIELGNINYEQTYSSGRDKEVKLAKSLGIPVFYSIAALYSWSQNLH